MMEDPPISVVMSVYNNAAHLAATVDSVLEQDADFEFLIINDGSTDASSEILQDYANRDHRIRLVEQENHGLTRALITGCKLAKGDYIARHDAGDVSLPGRLQLQLEAFQTSPGAVMSIGGCEFLAPDGEVFNSSIPQAEKAWQQLRSTHLTKLESPGHHGCMMFSKKAYAKVGGYRAEFAVAQDLDLWTRLSEVGTLSVIPKVIYQAGAYPDSISYSQRDRQMLAKRLIHQAALARRAGKHDADILNQAEQDLRRPTSLPKANESLALSRFNYFVGACLKQSNPSAARKYFRRAWQHDLFNVKAAVRYLTTR